MQIVGNGFLARHFGTLSDRHDGVVLLAAGVSWAADTSDHAFAREAALVRGTAERCRAEGTRLVFFSTASTGMYGDPGCEGVEDAPVEPRTPYGRHKLSLEKQIAESGTDHLTLRLAHVVGPGGPSHQLVPSLVRQVRSGRVTVHRGAARDLIGIDDVVGAVDRLLTLGVSGEVVNLASGVAVPVTAIVDWIEQRTGTCARRCFVDSPGVNHRVSIDKLRRLAGPELVAAFTPDYHRRILDAHVELQPTT